MGDLDGIVRGLVNLACPCRTYRVLTQKWLGYADRGASIRTLLSLSSNSFRRLKLRGIAEALIKFTVPETG